MNQLDNIELLKYALPPLDEDQYYFVQIMRRKKEHPTMPKSVRIMDEFYITKNKPIKYYENRIIGSCNLHKARAYISVNRRSKKKSALKMISHLASLIESDQLEPNTMNSIYPTVSGRFPAEPKKKWIIDIDEEDLKDKVDIIDNIKLLYPNPGENKVLFEVPTVSGLHLITTPFRLDMFKKLWPQIDVHKDNYTILYAGV